jgi:hypothetical protein
MPSQWKKLALAPVLALSLSLAACEQVQEPLAPQPGTPDPVLGGLLSGGRIGSYALVREPLLSGLADLRLSKLVGVDGGELTLLGHTLRVPAGAVPTPTLFTLVVLPTGYVQVSLDATLSTATGLLNVGSEGFLRPVPVTLTYSRATNVADPSKLKVVRLAGPLGLFGALTGKYQIMPSAVDPAAQTVTAELEHFSDYALVVPE